MLGAAVKTLPLGGHDISEFILRRLRERGEPVPSEGTSSTFASAIHSAALWISTHVLVPGSSVPAVGS